MNDICADKKPVFFKHRYYTSRYNDKLYKDNMNFYSVMHYDNKLVSELDKNSVEEKKFLDICDHNSVLIDYNSVMNQVCHYMEEQLECLKKPSMLDNSEVIQLLRTYAVTPDDEKCNIIRQYCDLYYENKTKFKQGINKEYNTIDQAAKDIREKCLEYFENSEELANYVVEVCYIEKYHQSKSFAWNVFGKFLLNNIIKNSNNPIMVPIYTENGSKEYLYTPYDLYEVKITEDDSDDADI